MMIEDTFAGCVQGGNKPVLTVRCGGVAHCSKGRGHVRIVNSQIVVIRKTILNVNEDGHDSNTF